jgi:hypothetical protein
MVATYSYSLSGDFGGQLNIDQFGYEVKDNVVITTTFIGMSTDGDDIKIYFVSSISGAEETELDALVSAHTPNNDIHYTKHIILHSRKVSYGNSSYHRARIYHYGGSRTDGLIQKITITGYQDSSATSYSVRMMDVTNHKVMAEATFTNTMEADQEILTITNIPLKKAKIEFHVKKTGGNSKVYAYIEAINIYI